MKIGTLKYYNYVTISSLMPGGKAMFIYIALIFSFGLAPFAAHATAPGESVRQCLLSMTPLKSARVSQRYDIDDAYSRPRGGSSLDQRQRSNELVYGEYGQLIGFVSAEETGMGGTVPVHQVDFSTNRYLRFEIDANAPVHFRCDSRGRDCSAVSGLHRRDTWYPNTDITLMTILFGSGAAASPIQELTGIFRSSINGGGVGYFQLERSGHHPQAIQPRFSASLDSGSAIRVMREVLNSWGDEIADLDRNSLSTIRSACLPAVYAVEANVLGRTLGERIADPCNCSVGQ